MSKRSSQETNNPRRSFLKTAALAAAAAPLAGQLLRVGEAKAKDNVTMLSPDDPMAKNLKYVEDATKAEGRQPNATCANCQLYTKTGTKDGKEVGTCTLFMNPTVRHVYAAAWCSAWVSKPGA